LGAYETESCTSGGLGLAPMQASFPLESIEQKWSVVDEEHLYGCISPYGSPCPSSEPDVLGASESEGMDGILDPVLQITQEFYELCGESSKVLPSELGSYEALAPSLQSPTSAISGGVLTHSSDNRTPRSATHRCVAQCPYKCC
jgi:hypothetical protein